MSTITPTYLNGDLTALRTTVAGMQDSLPFVLLPLRMETRFMQVDVPVATGQSLAPPLGDAMIDFEPNLKVTPSTSPSTLLTALKGLNTKASGVNVKFVVGEAMAPGAYEVLGGMLTNLEALVATYLSKAIPKNPTQVQLADIQTQKQLLQSTMATLRGKYQQQSSKSLEGSRNFQAFRSKLQDLQAAMAGVTQMDTTLQPKQQRNALYVQLDQHLAASKTAFRALRKTYRNDMTASAADLTELKALGQAILAGAAQVDAKVSGLWSDYKRAEYQQKFSRLTQSGMNRLQGMLERQVYPRLDYTAQLQVGNLHALEWQLRKLKYESAKAAAAAVSSANMTKARQGLDPIAKAIKPLISALLGYDAKSIAEVDSLLAASSKSLVAYRKKLVAFTNTSATLLATRDKEVAWLDVNVLPLSSQLQDARNRSAYLRNKDGIRSAQFLSDCKARLAEMTALLPTLAQPAARANLKSKLVAYNKWLGPQLQMIRLVTDLAKQGLLLQLKNIRTGVYNRRTSYGPADTALLLGIVDAGTAGLKAARPDIVGTSSLVTAPELKLQITTETEPQLWVRVYPDDIAVTTHEPLLTKAERDSGRAYWEEVLAANGDPDLMLGAWRAMVASYGSYRSAWIVNLMDPKKANTVTIVNKIKDGLNPKLTVSGQKLREALKQLKAGSLAATTAQPLGGLNLTTVTALFTDARTLLLPVTQGYAPFLDRYGNLLRNLQSYLNRLHKLVQTNSVPPAVVTRLNAIFAAYSGIVTKYRSIVPITLQQVWASLGFVVKWPIAGLKNGSWTMPPRSTVMPDRFAVICMKGDSYERIEIGNTVVDKILQCGINPSLASEDAFAQDEYGNMAVDPGMKWMVDYAEAVSKGLGITLRLSEEEAESGYDKVFVLGVREATPAAARTLLENLLNGHHYAPNGMAFVPVGTATNNTETGESGWRSAGEDEALSFAVERNSELPVTTSSSTVRNDGLRLAQALGISEAVLSKIYLHDATSIANAYTMNEAMWPATMGYYMEEMLDTFFTLDNINRTRTFFEKNVSGRGHLPTLRVGTNPYGFLVTTAYSQFKVQGAEEGIPTLTEQDFSNPAAIDGTLQVRFEARLYQLLRLMHSEWKSYASANAKSVADEGVSDPQSYFMEILGLEASALEYYYLYNANVANRRPSNDTLSAEINWSDDDSYGPSAIYEFYKDQFAGGYYYTSDEFADEDGSGGTEEEKLDRINSQVYAARLFKTRYLDSQGYVTGDLVVPGETYEDGSSTDVSTYINTLLADNPWDTVAENVLASFPSQSLLGTMLRYTLLLAYRDAALNILTYEGLITEKLRKIMGQSGFYSAYNSKTKEYDNTTRFSYLLRTVKDLNGLYSNSFNTANSFYTYVKDHPMNWYLNPEYPSNYTNYSGHSSHDASLQGLNKVKAAMTKLGSLEVPELKRLLAEHIDLSTYRLDAWEQGFAVGRLEKQRSINPTGLYLGAFAWVENLRPANDRTPATDIPDGLYYDGEEPIYLDADNQGFIHAPSLTHAVTAAILRAGYNNNPSSSDQSNSLSVNLSTERVRMGMDLLDGVRNGMSTGAVLGYQFERGLHERYLHLSVELDQYIYDFRDEFPGKIAVDSENTTGNLVGTVVDGLALLEEAEEIAESIGVQANENLYETLSRGMAAAPGVWPWLEAILSRGSTELDCVLREIDRMANALDALGDLSIAESVYQVAKGNSTRASVFMDALANGKSMPRPEIINTPRTGTVVNSKVTLHFDPIRGTDISIADAPSEAVLNARLVAADAYAASWTAEFSPRAFAEPSMNKRLGEFLGDPTKICCLVRYTVAEVETSVTVSLGDLGLQPLDCLHLLAPGLQDGGTEFNKRVAYFVRDTYSITEDVALSLAYTERDSGWASDVVSIYEMEALFDNLKQLLLGSAPATAADYYLETSTNTSSDTEVDTLQQDTTELRTRMVDAQTRLQAAYDALGSFYATEVSIESYATAVYNETQLDSLRGLLLDLAAFGIGNCIPTSAVDVSDAVGAALHLQSQTAYAKAGERLSAAASSLAAADTVGATKDTMIASLRQMAVDIFGRGFNALPHFSLRNATEISDQMTLASSSGLLRDSSEEDVATWRHQVARVRKPMAALENLALFADAFGLETDSMSPLQLPFVNNGDPSLNDHWVALEFPSGWSPSEDKVSVAVYHPELLYTDATAGKCAIVVDNWVEIVPREEETTGIAIHYNNPDAKAPQACLVAVTPQVTGAWSWDNLVYTLVDTLEMAKIRAVEPDHLQGSMFAQLMPGVAGETTDGPPATNVVMDYGWITATTEE